MVSYFSNTVHKDILFQLRNQRGVDWQIPDDIGSEYLRQIDAEVRRGEGKTARWVKRHNDNHAVDCETMQIVLASIFGLIGTPESETEESWNTLNLARFAGIENYKADMRGQTFVAMFIASAE